MKVVWAYTYDQKCPLSTFVSKSSVTFTQVFIIFDMEILRSVLVFLFHKNETQDLTLFLIVEVLGHCLSFVFI